MQQFEHINEFNKYLNLEDSKHPLIDIRRYSDIIELLPNKSEPEIRFLQNCYKKEL